MLNDIFQIVILGIIQGVSEFLPISSSAHVSIIQLLTGYDLSLEHEAILNIGSFLALVILFKNELLSLLSNKKYNFHINVLYKIALTSIPTLVIAYLIKDYLNIIKSQYFLIAIVMIISGSSLYLVDKYNFIIKSHKDFALIDTIVLALLEPLSLIRGISRSGISMIGLRGLGFNREDSATISFLMAIPVLGAVSLYGAKSLINPESNYTVLIFGFLSSFISSYFSMKILINYLRKNNFLYLAIYRILFGLLLIIFLISTSRSFWPTF